MPSAPLLRPGPPRRFSHKSRRKARVEQSNRGTRDPLQEMEETDAPEISPEAIQEQILSQITHGARICAEVERQLGQHPAPELETIIKLHRVLILKFSLEAQGAPELLELVSGLMKPVMDWARLQEQRRRRELAEQMHREQADARKTADAREAKAKSGETALTPETLEKIERELHLL